MEDGLATLKVVKKIYRSVLLRFMREVGEYYFINVKGKEDTGKMDCFANNTQKCKRKDVIYLYQKMYRHVVIIQWGEKITFKEEHNER